MKKSLGQSEFTSSPTQEEISQRARELWAGYDRPAGRDQEIWLEAERQLLGADPLVEGRGNISVAAPQFDEATRQKKPVTRLKKPQPKVKSPAPRPAFAKKSAKTAKTVKASAPVRTTTPARKKSSVTKR